MCPPTKENAEAFQNLLTTVHDGIRSLIQTYSTGQQEADALVLKSTDKMSEQIGHHFEAAKLEGEASCEHAAKANQLVLSFADGYMALVKAMVVSGRMSAEEAVKRRGSIQIQPTTPVFSFDQKPALA